MPLKKIIVGLGNPGREYLRTRHNLGFWVVDLLAQKLEAQWGKAKFKSELAETQHAGWNLILAKPITYMNLSGEAVQLLTAYYQVPFEDLLIICDDIALPLGKIRLRKSGGAGGHHGLESIIEALGTQAFPRLRLGIKPLEGDLPQDLAEFVLSPFRRGEEAIAAESAKRGVDAILFWLENGIEATMNRFNA
jgi:PTH1 family peptidyl-tRNA hydrolase